LIKVQEEPFDAGAELASLSRGRTDIGAVASFTGLVRDMAAASEADARPVAAMTLEHYPGMTEKKLAEIEDEARRRWPLQAVLIVHRYGRLLPGEPIVLVAAASTHRKAALEACAFLIDWLKTKAPFWKLEEGGGEASWVDARASDDEAAARWRLPAEG
jgi:molybdopterin synthase catalytic subunit